MKTKKILYFLEYTIYLILLSISFIYTLELESIMLINGYYGEVLAISFGLTILLMWLVIKKIIKSFVKYMEAES